jgi:predicted enzyme related to lactoylglutathione lyase
VRDTIQCLGWYVRRTPDVPKLGAFYEDGLGLPDLVPNLIPPGNPRWIAVLWGGETTFFEVMQGGTPPAAEPTITPVFRCHDLDATIARLVAAGGAVGYEEPDDHGQTVFLRDPLGHLLGLRYRERSSPLAQDREAWRRWDDGGTAIPNVAPLPTGLVALDWIILRVADLPGEVAFYRDVIGLDVVARSDVSALLSLGDMALLEIRPGGASEPIPTDRGEINDMWMIRLRDLPGMVADLKRQGVRFVNEPFESTGGVLAYVVDPEGHLIGIQDHPLDPASPVEVEAWRRWIS